MAPSLDRSQIPHKPGTYIYKDAKGKIIYAGKAIDLYHRVASYFSSNVDVKISALREKIASVETIVVESELEALILEANLIKKYRPEFNIRLTDDKDYLYIKVSKGPFPKIVTARKNQLQDAKFFFGPFPSGRTVKDTLKALRRVFPWCSGRGLRGRPCFYYHLNLCPGACVGKISKKDYSKNILMFQKFMEGQKERLYGELTKEMKTLAKNEQFEQAAKTKKTLDGILYLTQSNRTQVYLENPNFLEDQRQKALEDLKKGLSLKEIPERIEGYDISNIQGHQATGSMVVLTNGEIDKSQYRKFKILISGKPNDYAMLVEMMRRRLKHPEWPLPQLFLIDGGRGQARAVEKVYKENIPRAKRVLIFGIAKRMEWLYPPEGEIIKLPRSSLALRLLQKLRDEAHRFAISYHRKLRDKIE